MTETKKTEKEPQQHSEMRILRNLTKDALSSIWMQSGLTLKWQVLSEEEAA
jgi:hypothetical protein